MPIGTVKFFNASKGYGFIQPEGGGSDAFVHISAVERSGMTGLNENQRVSYDLEQDRRGKMSAINLKSPKKPSLKRPRPRTRLTPARPSQRPLSRIQASRTSKSPRPESGALDAETEIGIRNPIESGLAANLPGRFLL